MSETPNPGRKRQQIFREAAPEDDAPASLSLRSYISKRLQENAASPAARPAPPPIQPSRESLDGQRINSLDTELVAGFEQFLPTPAIRLRVVKERLSREIDEMLQRLAQYKALDNPSPEACERIAAMEERLNALKRHEAQVERQLSVLFSQRSLLFQACTLLTMLGTKLQEGVNVLSEKVLAPCSPTEVLRRTDPPRYQMVALNKQLQSLSEVLDERITAPNARESLSPTEISDILNQYDHTLRQTEALAETLRNRPSLRDKLNQRLREFYRSLYA